LRKILSLATIPALLLAFAGVALADTFEGTQGNDRIVGTDSLDRIFGNAGNDDLFGRGGNDRIFGQSGNDTIVGGDGEDYLDGGPGDDTIYTGTLTLGDKVADEVRCGNGYDVVYLDGKDHASHTETGDSCEETRNGKHIR
jgi:RTX calcium-binding nonapeptide repeat (4 copies)